MRFPSMTQKTDIKCKKPLSAIETQIHSHLVGKGTLHG